MPLIFQIEPKPKYKSKTVFGVEIPIYGEMLVDEVIAVERAIVTDIDRTLPISNTEWAIIQVSAWLSVRLGVDVKSELRKSKALCDALWSIFYDEQESKTDDYEIEESVATGKDKDPAQSLTLIGNGTPSTSNLQAVDFPQNSLMVLDNSVSA